MEAVRLALSRRLFSPLQGMTLATWRRLLAEPGHAIGSKYQPRAAFQWMVATANSAAEAIESRRFAPPPHVPVPPPLFILGHFRSGTTHLHNLLSLDPRLTFPSLVQTLYPRTFRVASPVVAALGRPFLMRTRPHDGVALDFGVPNEDELALMNDAAISPYLAWTFPRRAAHHDRFLTFRDASLDEISAWTASLTDFLRRLALADPRPVVLKSPAHTARLPLLLAAFPDARFVHIRRDPHAVFRSSRHMVASTMPFWRLQDPLPDAEPEDDRILRIYREMYDAYFDARPSIPSGQLVEIAYEDLERDPIGQHAFVHDALSLPGFAAVQPLAQRYLARIGGYRKNAHAESSAEDRRRVSREWARSFAAWSYPE